MHLFDNYIQPLLSWFYIHPNWALVITFFIAFTESLAIIGSIIPGSVTMTAIGILAGSGVMRIDLTLLAAILGAFVGDSASYLLGYIFSDRLVQIWPFSRYPKWLSFGKDYFARHGGKSVLVGRFVGPLRSIIPVIAGMMHMNHWRFFVANILSAIGWSILYVVPGILIGTASSELSPETATRLFLLVLLLLVALWMLSMVLKWLLMQANRLLRLSLHDFWAWSSKHPYLAKLFKLLTPAGETHYYQTVSLVILFVLSSLFFLLTLALVIQNDWLATIQHPIHLFLQSLRTTFFDIFFISAEQLTSSLALSSLSLTVMLITIYYRDWRSLVYWLGLNFSCIILLLLMQKIIAYPRPQGIFDIKSSSSFPIINLSLGSALFSALIFYSNTYCKKHFNLIKLILSLALLFAGFAPIYLGDHWLVDSVGAYLFGFSFSLLFWLFYRRYPSEKGYPAFIPLIILAILLIASAFSCFLNLNKSLRSHQPYFAQYVFTDERWWNQQNPLLPTYYTNRIGQAINLFNVQYAGSLENFIKSLVEFGWQKRNESLSNRIVMRIRGESALESPLMAPLYLNRKPVLIMTYQASQQHSLQILRIWRSNYHLKHFRQPIWLGSVYAYISPATTLNKVGKMPPSILYLSKALPTFSQRTVPLPPIKTKFPQGPTESILLLVREEPTKAIQE